MCVDGDGGMYQGTYVEVRGQLYGVSSHLPSLCGFWDMNPGPQAVQLVFQHFHSLLLRLAGPPLES